MKVIIAGSRGICDYSVVCEAIEESEFDITEVVSGTAQGIDRLGERWAVEHCIGIKMFPAKWENTLAPNAVIRTRKDGSKYNAKAGHDRNKEMADYAEALIAIWDGKSRGTESMIKYARQKGLLIFVKIV